MSVNNRMSPKAPTVILLLLALSISAGRFLISCGSDAKDIRNVILISIDTCRADHLSCYGYNKKTTPNIDKLAQESILFSNAYSPVPLTLAAHSSMLTGTIPPYHGVHDNIGYRLDQSNITLAEVLGSNELTTAAVVSSYVLDSKFGLKQGFDYYNDSPEKPILNENIIKYERKGKETSNIALEWLDKHRNERFFLFLHYFDPHQPYEPPEPFSSTFSEDPYAGEIAYTDYCIGQIITKLKDLGLYDSALIIITGDHGEMLGEHGEDSHCYFIYQSALKVPLIFKLPGHHEAKKIDDPVGLIDIVPTICNLMKIPTPSNIQGKNLSPYFDGKQYSDPDRCIYCESVSPTKYKANSLLGVVSGRWKFIQTTRPELYDLAADPGETNNLIIKEHNRARILKDALKQILKNSVRKDISDGKAVLNEVEKNRLESLGYLASAHVSEDFEFDQSKADPKDWIDFHRMNSRGIILINSNRLSEAKVLYKKMLKEFKPNVEILVHLAHIASQQDLLDEAITHLDAALPMSTEPEEKHFVASAHNQLGIILERKNRIDEAIKQFSEALRINPELFGVHSNLGQALALKLKMDEAIKQFNEALRINPDFFEAHYNMGELLVKQGKPDEAIHHFNEAIRINPDYAEAYQKLGDILRRQGKIQKAIEQYGTAVRLRPHFSEAQSSLEEAHFVMGNILVGKGEISEAIFHFQEALRINNSFAEAHTNLGYALLTQGKEDEAIKHCLEAIRLDPEKSINAYYNLACIYARKNKATESVDWLKKAVDKGFNDWDTLKADKDLENIRTTAYYNEIYKSGVSTTKPGEVKTKHIEN